LKNITFHINNAAYTIDIGTDADGSLEAGLKQFLSTDRNLSLEDLLLAYLRKTQEHVQFQKKLDEIVTYNIPSLEKLQ